MLKISDYVAIVLGFLGILAFYLIFSGNWVVDYGTNTGLPVIEREAETERIEPDVAKYVVLVGEAGDSDESIQIAQMLNHLKLEYIVRNTLDQLSEEQKETAQVFIVTDKHTGDKQEILSLAKEEGKRLFYPTLSATAGDEEYEKELGILKSKEDTTIDGIIIFEGILLQGMVYYEDYSMEVRDISLDASCTKLIQERNNSEKEQSDLVPILWKKRYGNGEIYVSNGELFAEESGIGIFTGVLTEMEGTFAYPIVNSSTVLLDYYPDFEHVNPDAILRQYSRDPVMYIRDIIWPAMDKIATEEQLIISGRTYINDKTDDFDDIELMIQRSGGIVLEGQEGMILPSVCEGHLHSDEKRYEMESFSSGEGLASCYLDMRDVTGDVGQEPEFEWASYSLELAKNMHDLYRNNQFLEQVNWKEAEERYKRYEKIKPQFDISDEEIRISAEGFVDVWYCIIRTEEELQDGEGYEVQEVGKNAYLLEITQQEITVPIA